MSAVTTRLMWRLRAKLPLPVVQVGRKSLMRWPSWWWLNRRERALQAED